MIILKMFLYVPFLLEQKLICLKKMFQLFQNKMEQAPVTLKLKPAAHPPQFENHTVKNPIARWAFTAWCDQISLDDLKSCLSEHCKKWIFQKECAPSTGKLHYQGRISLKVKNRKTHDLLPKLWCSPEHSEDDSTFYCSKSETRIDGPWSDKDKKKRYIPRQVREMDILTPMQEKIIASAKIQQSQDGFDTRTIDCIVNPDGGMGKSAIRNYVMAYGLGVFIPISTSSKDVMRMVMDMAMGSKSEPKGDGFKPLYIIDIPKAVTNNQKLENDFYGAIENLKDGFAYDDRYGFRWEQFDSPAIWVFTNSMPDKSAFTAGRWRFWSVHPDNPFDIVCTSGSAQIVQGPKQFKSKYLKFVEERNCSSQISDQIQRSTMPIGIKPTSLPTPLKA